MHISLLGVRVNWQLASIDYLPSDVTQKATTYDLFIDGYLHYQERYKASSRVSWDDDIIPADDIYISFFTFTGF